MLPERSGSLKHFMRSSQSNHIGAVAVSCLGNSKPFGYNDIGKSW